MDNQQVKLIITAAVALLVGYFAGREHMKQEIEADLEHEMRTLLMESIREFKERPLETRMIEDAPRVNVPPPQPLPNIK